MSIAEELKPPREGLVRAVMEGGVRLAAASDEAPPDDGRIGTLVGHFARFNEWTTIDSAFEGTFMERIAPGAFTKTIAEQRDGMRVLFQHGQDPQIGDKPLGPIDQLREDDVGAYYEVPLLDTSYNRDLLPGLENDLYGASFRFRVMRESMDNSPKRSDRNPDGLPERTIKEVSLREFGPVTFPAYAGATAGVRSLTDEFALVRLVSDARRLAQLVSYLPNDDDPDADTDAGGGYTGTAPSQTGAALTRTPVSGRRATGKPLFGTTKRRNPTWLLT